MREYYTPEQLLRMMAGSVTGTPAAAFVEWFRNPDRGSVFVDLERPTLWSEAEKMPIGDGESYAERHATLVRRLAENYYDQRELALYLAEAIAHALKEQGLATEAVMFGQSDWEHGMPEPATENFSLRVALLVPGMPETHDGKLFFHFDTSSRLVGGGLQFPLLPNDPTSARERPSASLDVGLAAALFNVVLATLPRNDAAAALDERRLASER